MNFAVLGLGRMGEAIVYDLLKFSPEAKVFGYELNDERRKYIVDRFSENNNRFSAYPLNLDLTQPMNQNQLLNDFKNNQIGVVFGAIDYKFNVYLTRLCIEAKVSFCDLGGNPYIVKSQKELHNQAKEAGVTIIPDLGLAPGMADIIAAQGMGSFDELIECHIRVGGLPQPQYKKSILNYQQVFSIRGLTNEYLEDAIVIRNGQLTKVPSMTEVEDIKFPAPYGMLEAFQTAGGTSSLPELFEGKIQELTYKTIRYPGHAQFIQFLKEFELLSSESNLKLNGSNPREVVEFYLEKNMPKGDPDVVLIKIVVYGKRDGTSFIKEYLLVDEFNPKTNFTSMARTTSYPISIIGQMIANGVINSKGVIPGETVVPEKEFLEDLEKRNIVFTVTEKMTD